MVTWKTRSFAAAVAILAILAAQPAVHAQLITGSVTGSVVDASQAAIPGASVTLTNLGTGITQAVTSDASGNYQFLQLPPGTYRLEATLQGFSTFRRDGIIVEAARSSSVPIQLRVGSIAETVEVVGGMPLLEPTTSALGTVIDQLKVESLPLAARNPMGLASLVPTVRAVGFFGQQVLTTFSGSSISVGGGTTQHNGFLIDGMANDKLGDATGPMTSLTVDATQEFKVLTNSMSAEFGRTGGGVVSVISKSGTNRFGGSLFEYHRNDKLNTNSFFANRSGAPKSPLRINQYGGTLGGPIKREKIFFFLNYEGYRELRSVDRIVTAPTERERVGDFSQTLGANGQLITIYDPLTTRPDPSRPGFYIRDPFPGNRIPENRIAPIAREVMKLYPMANLPGDPVTGANNLFQRSENPIDRDNWGVKLDYNLSSTRRLAGRYTKDVLNWYLDDFFGNILDAGARRYVYLPRHSASVQFTDTLGGSVLIDAKTGYNRDFDQGIPASTIQGGFDLTDWGFPASLRDQIPLVQNSGIGLTPRLNIGDLVPIGGGVPHGRLGYTWASSVALTKTAGRHTLKGGYEHRFYGNEPFDGMRPVFSFNRGFTQGPDPTRSSALAGYGLSSFMLGYPASGSMVLQPLHAKTTQYHAAFVQEDWHATQKLTLNIGLRYEFETPIKDRNNVFANFDPSMDSPLRVPGLTLKGGLRFPGVDGVPREITDRSYGNFGPRVGFAYQARESVVVRGGYGMFYPPVKGNSITNTATGFSAETVMVASLDGGLTPFHTIADPFPTGLVQPSGSSLAALTGVGSSVSGQLRDATPDYVQQWNLTLQVEPWSNWLIEAAYIGNKGTGLMTIENRNLNQLAPEHLALGNQLLAQVSNPFFGIIKSGPLSQPTVARQQLLRPFPQYTDVSGGWSYFGRSIYNALALKVEKRLSHGVSVLASYTRSRMLDAAVGPRGNIGSNTNIVNWYDLDAEWSKSGDDLPHRFVMTMMWQLPFAQGVGGWREQVLGGWHISTITTLESGRALALQSGAGNRPNVVPGADPRVEKPTVDRWFNTAAFEPAAPFTYGNASRTLPTVMSDGLQNVDLSVFKDFPLGSRMRLQFRGAAYNLLNTPTFNAPNEDVTNRNFGIVTSTGLSTGSLSNPGSRELQLGFRLTF